MILQNVIYGLDLFGTAVFALSGVVAAGRQRMDPFGVMVLATLTAVGGGTIRDLVIGAEQVFWVADPIYLLVIFLTAQLAMLIMLRTHRLTLRSLPWYDAVGLAVFTLVGVEKALAHGVHPGVAVVMGIVTGVAGGMLRDLFAGQAVLVLKREIYATASFLGGLIYVVVLGLGADRLVAMLLCMAGVLALRLWAIHRGASLPSFDPEEDG